MSAALVIGLMAGTAAAKKPPAPSPTPTPTATPTPTPVPTPSGTRKVYFGDPADQTNGYGRLVLSPFTAGGSFTFDVIARNTGTQTLTHAVLGLGTGAETGPGSPATASLPTGSTIAAASIASSLAGVSCPFTPSATGFSCGLGSMPAGAWVKASFVVDTPVSAEGPQTIWASFKVAENVSDQGANANSFFASSDVNVLATGSNANATYLKGNSAFGLSTGATPPAGDKQTTSVQVPGDTAPGLIAIFESDGGANCLGKPCIGQLASVIVRDGGPQTPYVLWTLQINEIAANPSQGGVLHFEDDGDVVNIPNSNTARCKTATQVDCLVAYEVDKSANTTVIQFRTASNGAVRGY